ncbi:MAG: hypothetical protein ACKO5E_19985, partial [bacterium]
IFGSGNTPGLVMTGSSLTAMDITVNSNMNVAGLNLTATVCSSFTTRPGISFRLPRGMSLSVVRDFISTVYSDRVRVQMPLQG